MLDLRDLLREVAPEGAAWLDEALQGLARGAAQVAVLLPQLPRRVGRAHLPAGRRSAGDVVVELGAWRACDAAALEVLAAVRAPGELIDLYDHGDLEERTMVLRCAAALDVGPATGRLLAEVQRTNHVVHVVAGALDSNLLARALAAGPDGSGGFDRDAFNRLLLKLAFLDLPLGRAFDAAEHANPELSRMLQDLASEREAAGRNVSPDYLALVGRAPTAGTIARLAGALESGRDDHRAAAAEGAAFTGEPLLLRCVAERLPRERKPAVRTALERARRALEDAARSRRNDSDT